MAYITREPRKPLLGSDRYNKYREMTFIFHRHINTELVVTRAMHGV